MPDYKERYESLKLLDSRDISLIDHAEMWHYEQTGQNPPERGTPEHQAMYEKWIVFAFG